MMSDPGHSSPISATFTRTMQFGAVRHSCTGQHAGLKEPAQWESGETQERDPKAKPTAPPMTQRGGTLRLDPLGTTNDHRACACMYKKSTASSNYTRPVQRPSTPAGVWAREHVEPLEAWPL